jgi:dUTP pyrophosphatase
MEKRIMILKGDGEIPKYAKPGDAGADLYSSEDVWIHNGEVILVDTGIKIEIPEGFEGQIRTRSGFGKKGVFVINSPGTIDSGYRGFIKVALTNIGKKALEVKKGDRIAQIVFSPVVAARFIEVNELSETERGDGGFGHSGVK